ncbi:LysR family transcriptional regulator [Caulobacter sp. UC70_42]|uniref:LysR family transcriptional regulator n=1 Tax=Caulobacter sp. UC70_42 TaxID=3374551 RepID=UPI003756870F
MAPSERLKGIETFVVSADLGSFTAAAQRLNLTTSAVSKAVARLEDRVGGRLFHRTTRSLKLTDAGEAFYAACLGVLDKLSEAEAVLSHHIVPVGRIKLDLPVAFGRARVLPLLLDYCERYPAVRPNVTFTDRFIDILAEGVDLAVRIGGPAVWSDGLGHRDLGAERLVFCAAPNYLAERSTPQTPDDLTNLAGVLYGRGDGLVSPWRFGGKRGVEHRAVEPRVVLGSAEAQVQAVKAGFGVAQLATWLVGDALRSGELVELLPDYAVEGLTLNLVWPVERLSSPKVEAMVSLFAERLKID